MKRFAYSLGVRRSGVVPCSSRRGRWRRAQDSGVAGQFWTLAGKPWADIPVQIVVTGVKLDAKTDQNGKLPFINLPSGDYTITVNLPGQKEPYTAGKVKRSRPDRSCGLEFQGHCGKQGKDFEAAKQKPGRKKQKFQGMKSTLPSRGGGLDQARQAKDAMMKAACDQREALKTNVTSLNERP